jgi:hypothetical protein
MIGPVRTGSSESPSWILLGCALAALAALQAQDPFTIAPATAPLPAAGLLFLTTLSLYGAWSGRPRLRAASTAFLQMTLFTFLAVALAYEVAAHAGTLWDARLATWDRELGLDWPLIARTVDASPLLSLACGLAYHSLIPQMIVVTSALPHSAASECFARPYARRSWPG